MHMEIMEGSYGGRFGIDGMDAVDTLYANTRNNPIEDIESHIPIRVVQSLNQKELRVFLQPCALHKRCYLSKW